MVVVGSSAFKNCDDNAVSTRCGSACRDIPSKVRVNVVVPTFDVMPLTADLGIVGHRFAARHFMVELNRFDPLVFSQFASTAQSWAEVPSWSSLNQ